MLKDAVHQHNYWYEITALMVHGDSRSLSLSIQSIAWYLYLPDTVNVSATVLVASVVSSLDSHCWI